MYMYIYIYMYMYMYIYIYMYMYIYIYMYVYVWRILDTTIVNDKIWQCYSLEDDGWKWKVIVWTGTLMVN